MATETFTDMLRMPMLNGSVFIFPYLADGCCVRLCTAAFESQRAQEVRIFEIPGALGGHIALLAGLKPHSSWIEWWPADLKRDGVPPQGDSEG